MHQQRQADSSSVMPLSGRSERVELADFSFTRTPAGQCSAQVSLAYDEKSFAGRAIGQSSTFGDFRICAEAALNALQDFAKDAIHFELLGMKHVRAFDSDLLIVSVLARRD